VANPGLDTLTKDLRIGDLEVPVEGGTVEGYGLVFVGLMNPQKAALADHGADDLKATTLALTVQPFQLLFDLKKGEAPGLPFAVALAMTDEMGDTRLRHESKSQHGGSGYQALQFQGAGLCGLKQVTLLQTPPIGRLGGLDKNLGLLYAKQAWMRCIKGPGQGAMELVGVCQV